MSMGYHSDNVSFFIMRFICIAIFLFAAYLTFLSFHNSNLLLFMIAALPIGTIASCLFVRYFLPGIAEAFSDFLLMPRRFLDKAPMILSSYYGDLANGSFQKVISELQALPAHAFRDPEVVFIYAQACMNVPEYQREGLLKMENFFRSSAREKNNENNIRLLMYYADSARSFKPAPFIIQVLSKEAARKCYTDNEKRAILTRCAALGKGMRS